MSVLSKPVRVTETLIRAHGMSAMKSSQSGVHDKPDSETTSPNYLSLSPRKITKGNKCFDHDGPGILSTAGTRHDNDHVNVRNIKIFPTTDEILSRRAPYMPLKRVTQPHFLKRGPERLIDTLFRHLRHDSVEVLKDCTYAAAQKLATATDTPTDYDPCQETPNGNRHYLYWDAEFEELNFDDRKGLMARISYACPKSMRGSKMFKSGRFERGMVVALVGLDDDGESLSATFFEVHICQSTEAMDPRGGKGERASVRLLLAEKDNEDDVRRIVNYSQGLSNGRFVLVEFPKYLLNGFYPILKRIQNLTTYDLGLTRLYAPRSEGEENVGVLAPSYALRVSAFLDLDGFRKDSRQASRSNEPLKELVNNKERFLEIVKNESTLNDAQAEAFVETMSSEFAFVQGPPGTGKTYLGVALTKSILAARGKGKKPILVVCTTNHALDSFLGDLVKQGITDIARLGGGSKEEWTKKYALSSLTHSMRATETEAHMRGKAFASVNQYASSGDEICEAVNAPNKLGWYIAAQHLEKNYKSIYNQLVVASRPDDGLHSDVSDKAAAFPFAFWCAGGDLEVFDTKLQADFAEFLGKNNPNGGSLDTNAEIVASVLRDVIAQTKANSDRSDNNIWLLPLSERQNMLEKWASEIDQKKVADEIVDLHLQHHKAVSELKEARQSIEARCLAGKQVIGATTTACATNWDLLKSMGIEVVLCEEAGQVMEAHTICTLFQSIEHAIFIGDPLQLRPQVNEQSLSIETKVGSQYRLDESLFERLMDSKSGIPVLPYSQLNIQKRMHPEISKLLKKTLYPNLKDHPSTEDHRSIGGLSNRTYWIDHRIPENESASSGGSSKSFSNTFEVEMVAGLVRYLVNSNAYGLHDIVILTPYNGQLAELTSKLSSKCKLWLNEKDREALLDEGFLDEDSVEKPGPVDVNVKDMLRISTIDNFQGEEAKVVILTTVRSNAERRPGFLRTTNRINVACSRARDGFYVIGNSSSLESVPMWKDVIDVFRQTKNLGPSLRIMPCSRNPDHCAKSYDVSRPADFDEIPECESICGEVLPCGHTCKEICHPPEFHGTSDMKCKERCNKTHSECDHPCEKVCGEPCGTCEFEIGTMTLECGHAVAATCANDSWEYMPRCEAVVGELELDCGHKFPLKCELMDEKPTCDQNCIFELPCGHKCENKCAECLESGHSSCSSKCEKVLDCSHKCNVGCHPGQSCPPCEQPCKRRCSHKKCSSKCSDRCQPCTKVVSRGCDHRGSGPILCGLPSGMITCNEQKDYTMPCGHIFPGLCGEGTPNACVECETEFKPASAMISLSCGHSFDVGVLDRHVKFPSAYNETSTKSIFASKIADYDLTCPACGKGIEAVERYSDVFDILNLPNKVDLLISEIGHKLAAFGKSISFNESQLNQTFSSFCGEIRPTPLAASENRRRIQERGKELLEVQEQITTAKKDLVIPVEDNLQRLQKLFNNDAMMKKYAFQFSARFDLLFYRCRHSFLQELLKITSYLVTVKDPSYQTRVLAESLCRAVVKLGTENIDELGIVVEDCEEKKLPCAEVELRLLQLSIHCLVKRARKMNCLGRSAVADARLFDVIGVVNGQPDKKGSGSSVPELNAEASLTRIFALSERYPRSAGKYLHQANGTKSSLSNGLRPGPIFTERAREVERAWGELGVGGIARCGDKHPYPAGVFEDCPECGHEKTPAKAPDYEAHLSEERFLAWMRTQ